MLKRFPILAYLCYFPPVYIVGLCIGTVAAVLAALADGITMGGAGPTIGEVVNWPHHLRQKLREEKLDRKMRRLQDKRRKNLL